MYQPRVKLYPFFVLLMVFNSCKTNNKVVFLKEKAEVFVKVNSACRNSAILPLENETQLKNNMQSYSDVSMKRMKFKTNKEIDRSTHKLNKIELVINETCQTRSDNNPPSIKLQQKLIFENLSTKELLNFETDTIINDQILNPDQVALKKVNYQDYILVLTERNYKKAFNSFNKKK